MERVRNSSVIFLSSPALLAEFAQVIRRPKFSAILAELNIEPRHLLAELTRLAEISDPPPLPEPAGRNPDDDIVLALAAATRADMIVSGDKDLLSLGSYVGIPIVNATDAVTKLSDP